jgi:hypothetical protein
MPRKTRTVRFYPAWDHRDKGGGVHGVEIRFVLQDERGAIEYVLYTDWMLPAVEEWHTALRQANPSLNPTRPLVMAAGIFRHSLQPVDEDDRERCKPGECHIYPDGCYKDELGGFGRADDLFVLLKQGGDEPLWLVLESIHREVFYPEKVAARQEGT